MAGPNESAAALVGGGGHALVVGGAMRTARGPASLAGFYDDDPRAVVASGLGLRHLGALRAAAQAPAPPIIAVGDLARRRELIGLLKGREFATFVAGTADASHGVKLGVGVFVAQGAVVQTLAQIGDHAIVNTGAIVEHECLVGENVHLAPGSVLGGRVRVGADTLVGLGSRVLPGVRIGAGCTIGAGAVVTRDVADGQRVAGVPARPV